MISRDEIDEHIIDERGHRGGRRWWPFAVLGVLLVAVVVLIVWVAMPLLQSKELRFLKYKETAAVLSAKGEFSRATSMYKKALALKPGELDIARAIAECRLKMGDLPEAIAEYQRCLKMNQDDVQTQLTLASLYLLAKNMDRSAKIVDTILEVEPDNVSALMMRAQCHYERSDTPHPLITVSMIADMLPTTAYTYDSSKVAEFISGNPEAREKELLEAVKASPDNVQVYKNLADFYRRQKRFDESETQYKKMLELAPRDPYVHLHVADFYRNPEVGRLADSLREYSYILLNINSKNLFALRGAAGLSLATGAPDEASRYIEKLLWELPSDPYGRYFRAVLELFRNDMDRAEADLFSVVDRGGLSEKAPPHYLLGYAYLLNRKMKEARKSLDQAAKVDLTFSRARLLSAEVALNLGEYSEALEIIDNLLTDERHRDNPLAHLVQARVYILQNDYTQAESPLEKLAQLDGESVHPRLLLGEVYKRTVKSDQALGQYDLAIKADPDSPLAFYLRGLLYEKRGEPTLARLDLQKAVEKNPNFAAAANTLADTYLKQAGENADARALGQTLLDQFPNDFVVLDALGMVFYQQGKFDQAVEIYELIPPRERDARPQIVYNYGMALLASGRKALAQRGPEDQTRRAHRKNAEARTELEKAARWIGRLPKAEEIQETLDEINQEQGITD
jgi:tetratricopeptide (TPR) repeat protein